MPDQIKPNQVKNQIKEYAKLFGFIATCLVIGSAIVSLTYWTAKLESRAEAAGGNATKCLEKLELYEPQIEKGMQFRIDAGEQIAEMRKQLAKMDRNILILCIRSGVDCEKGER